MEVTKKQLADIFAVSVRTIQNWQEQGMPVASGGGKGNEVKYDSAVAIAWFSARDAGLKTRNFAGKLRIFAERKRPISNPAQPNMSVIA
jgi:phage terminase Nu1 subunit (DNA packaging protein)